jgi:hypothetical protein
MTSLLLPEYLADIHAPVIVFGDGMGFDAARMMMIIHGVIES